LLAAAAARVIYTSSGAGVITLMVIGALLLVSPFVIARVERLSVNARGSTRQLTRTATAAGWPPRCAPFPSPDLSHPRVPARTFRLLSRVPP